jgi:hypothetical protein
MRVNLDMAGINHEPLVVHIGDQLLQEFFPNTGISPTAKAPVCVAPASVFGRQVAPRSARAQDPKDGIDELSIVFAYAAPIARTPWQMRLQERPCVIADVVPVKSRISHDEREKSFAIVIIAKLFNLVTTLSKKSDKTVVGRRRVWLEMFMAGEDP